MSVRLLKPFLYNLRQYLPRQPLTKPGQIRTVTVMDVAAKTEGEDKIIPDKNFTRYKKRFMKRQWEDSPQDKKENGESEEKKLCEKPAERIKRKKMAMLLGYCGVDYYGMQRNPGVRTIEEDLLKALFDAKYITEEDFNNQQNAQFQRSSRTDKGVSAARQVVSLKLPLEVNIEEINSRLPECIRVFGIKRVTNKFNSKIKCNARTYSYTLPTYVLEPSLKTEEERKLYRISEEKLKSIGDVLALYKGTKSYHNFTEKKHYQDPSACRYMMGFTLDRVFVESDWEFAELLVKGQSFMLHQIRKMIGFMIAIVRGQTDIATLEKAFGKDKVMIPTAPGLGLVLDKVHYERYDAKYKESHDSLTWDAEEESVQKFKDEKINPVIVKGEIEGNSMGMWLEKLSTHSFEPSEDVPEEKEIDSAQKGIDSSAKGIDSSERGIDSSEKGIDGSEKGTDSSEKRTDYAEKDMENVNDDNVSPNEDDNNSDDVNEASDKRAEAAKID